MSFPQPRPSVMAIRATLARIARVQAAPSTAVLTLFGEIGVGKPVSLASVQKQLDRAPHAHRLNILINSPGGNLREAFRIYSALREHPAAEKAATITTHCNSAAVLPLLAADHRAAKAGAVIHLHGAGLRLKGERFDARRMRLHAQALSDADAEMVDVLVERTGGGRDALFAALRADKPLRPSDLLSLGILHDIEGMGRPCDRAWPGHVDALMRAGGGILIGLPRHMLSSNYLRACRSAPIRKPR